MKKKKFSLVKQITSIKHALNGLKVLYNEEHNSRIHFVLAIATVILGFVVQLKPLEWVAIIFAIGMVISLEIINTAIENISDFISPEQNESIKRIKDLGAAAVLIGAITAMAIGLVVFVPKVLMLMN